jgi:hypothetical protein
MADQCIVCLGELAALAVPLATDKDIEILDDENGEAEVIAHLLPCQHNLHDACLKPWVERANSCPICRQTFHKVELRAFLNGKFGSFYFFIFIFIFINRRKEKKTIADRVKRPSFVVVPRQRQGPSRGPGSKSRRGF